VVNIESALPRPSLASSLWTSRDHKESNDVIFHQECPTVAGDGFEPVNGYDYPFSPHLPGSYNDTQRVKSVAYASRHWTSGGVLGDRVTASCGLFGRVMNMLKPKPRLQVLPQQQQGERSSSDTMPGHFGTYFRDDTDTNTWMNRSEMELQDISQTSAMVPVTTCSLPMENRSQRSTTMHGKRKIETIYEADVPRSVSVSADSIVCLAR
jgi:hypothetical protein